MAIKAILLSVLSALGVLLLAALALLLSESGARLNEAMRARQANQVTDLILSASGEWAQERGLTNLLLNAPDAAPADAIVRIHTLRAGADANYQAALKHLPKAGIISDSRFSQQFDTSYTRLGSLRRDVDTQLTMPKSRRDGHILTTWFPAISEVITQSQLSSVNYSSQVLNTTSVIAKDAIMRHNLWLMSEYAGRERGMVAGIIASGKAVSPEQLGQLSAYRANLEEGWTVVSHLKMRDDEATRLGQRIEAVRTGFFEDYDAVRTRILAEGRAGKPYSLSASAWFDTATQGIDLILDLEKANALYVDASVKAQQRTETLLLVFCTICLVAGVFAVAAAFWLVNKHVLYTVANLNAIFDNAADGLITIDAKGAIKSFNPACETIFGRTAKDVRNHNVKILMPEPDQGRHDGFLAEYLKTGEAHIIGKSGREVSGLRKDGTTFPMDLAISRFALDDGTYFCAVIRDITRIKMAEEDREHLLKKLIDSNTELERFAYVASHDMQEPIRMVMSFSQIVIQDYETRLDDKGREYLNVLSDSAHRLLNMVNELLQYARLGRESMSYNDIDMADQIERVKLNLSELIKDSGATLNYGPMPHIRGNGVQVLRVLQNLIANAIKYRSPSRQPIIDISVETRDKDWLFKVSDNGLGIEKTYLDVIFEPFRRLHSQEDVKGVGFGLSICRKIVENHDGKIWVESIPGKGSDFYFTIAKTSTK